MKKNKKSRGRVVDRVSEEDEGRGGRNGGRNETLLLEREHRGRLIMIITRTSRTRTRHQGESIVARYYYPILRNAMAKCTLRGTESFDCGKKAID
jgi:hypothetical protein